MDDGKGNLELLDKKRARQLRKQNPNRQDIFEMGEVVKVKESMFRVVKITPKKLTLRILPKKIAST